MYLEMRFLGLLILVVCVVARDIVVDKNDERIQRYLKKYRRTSATVEKDNRPVAIPYRGRFTGGSYSYSRSRYTTGTESGSNDIEKQEERIKQERERWRESVQRREEQERLEKERESKEKLQQHQKQTEQQRTERERLQQQQQQEEQQRRERERLQQQQQQEEQQRRERERLQQQQQQEEQQRRERLEQKQQEKQQQSEKNRLQQLEEEKQQKQAQEERADRERRQEESQRTYEQQRLERDRRAREERLRRIEIERKRREQEQEQREAQRLRQQQEYEEAIKKQKEEYERQEKARWDEQKRRQDEENRRRTEEGRKQQEVESRRREAEQRRQQALDEERRRQQQQREQQPQPARTGTQNQGQIPGSTDMNQVRATLRTELEAIVREMRNQYEHSISGKNTLAGISRQLEVLLDRLNEQMQQEPTEETRNVKQQLEYWMRRLEQMAREDTFNCETAKREITSLKDKVDYVERLIVHQGRSRGSQYRRSTTPRPPTVPEVPDRRAEEQEPPEALTLQRPAEVSRPWQERQRQQQPGQQQHQRQHQTGHNQGSWRTNPTVDKWLPATRERYTTRMAASKRREQHMKKMKDESKRKSEQMVRGLQEADKRPWKPRRSRRPSKGLTGLLDHAVVNRAEVDPLDALWIEEHTAPRTIVVDSPGIKHPDWLIRQGQQRSSYTNGHRLKEINVYHHSGNDRRGTGDDGRLLGDQTSHVRVTDYQAPQQIPPRPESYSRQIHNTSGK